MINKRKVIKKLAGAHTHSLIHTHIHTFRHARTDTHAQVHKHTNSNTHKPTVGVLGCFLGFLCNCRSFHNCRRVDRDGGCSWWWHNDFNHFRFWCSSYFNWGRDINQGLCRLPLCQWRFNKHLWFGLSLRIRAGTRTQSQDQYKKNAQRQRAVSSPLAHSHVMHKATHCSLT